MLSLLAYVTPFFHAGGSPGLQLHLPGGGVGVYKKRLLLV
jgi:hypothetical protein